MPLPEPSGPWIVDASAVVRRRLRAMQARAEETGRGAEVNAAVHRILKRLRDNPTDFGEPIYRLPALRLQLRLAIVRPLAVDFAVSEEGPYVFIRGVKDLNA